MKRDVTVRIDRELCVGCEACVESCALDVLAMENGCAEVVGKRCIACGHCLAVCPENAVDVQAIDPDAFNFQTFNIDKTWLPYGDADTEKLVSLMMSRRSCRGFDGKPVEREIIDDLIRIGTTAPSGSNFQPWTFTVIRDRKSVVALGEKIMSFFSRLNSVSKKAWLRTAMKWIGKPELDAYYQEYYEQVQESIREWETGGKDRLFHGASSLILVGASRDASCPAEDSLLATQNILLAAHSMGIGTCLIGFAVSAMARDSKLCKFIGIPENEKVYSVIALGYPLDSYLTITGRKKVTPRYVNLA